MKTKLFTLFVALLATTNLWAEFQYGNLYYETLSSNTAKVVGYIGNPTSVSIPTLIQSNGKQYTVTSIGNFAFDDCSSLTSVTIPNSVTSIGSDAFRGCSSLPSVTIPNSVTSIGSSAFSGCSSLTSIVIPDGVTSIGVRAFYKCSSLTSIIIPDSVTSIEEEAFSGCSSLKQKPTQEIEMSNFKYRLLMHNHLAMVLGYSRCSATIDIPSEINHEGVIYRVTSIASQAFYRCDSLTSVVIPDGVTSIGEWAFNDCSSLTSIVIPNSVTSIEDRAFEGCSSLTSIIIPDGVTSIGCEAFNDCSSLTSIVIPDSVTSIGEWAFGYCSSLTSITFNGTKAQWKGIKLGDYWKDGVPTKVVHCIDGEVKI